MSKRAAERQQKAVSWVSRVGGFVRYDWQPKGRVKPNDPTGPRVPDYLLKTLGQEPFQSVRHIAVADPVLDDTTPLGTQTSLTELYVDSQYSTYDLTPISKLRRLEHLTLHASRFDSLAPLIGLPALKVLEIRDTVLPEGLADDFQRSRPDVEFITTPPTSERVVDERDIVRDWKD
ncbi:MAG: hypothetical protein ABI557_14965 [Aureliella sp.]